MINSYQSERITIEAHFKKLWGKTTPILFENTKQSPPKTGCWVRFQIIDSDKAQVSIGTSQLHRNVGQVFVNIFTKRGTGLGAITSLVDMAVEAFDIVQLDSIQFRAASKITVGDVGDEWFEIQVIAPYYRNSIVTNN